jgi:hypothetical protein
MPDLSAERRLVKSPPELWAEVSEVERLAKHLGAFGEIRITKLEPEKTVAWEGDHASGTVSIEASGWGTKVILTAEVPDDSPPAEEFEPEAAPEPEPELQPDPEPPDEPGPDEPPPAQPEPDEAAQAKGMVAAEAPKPSLDELAPLVGRRSPGFLGRIFGWRAPEPVRPEPEPPRERDWLENALVDSAITAHAGQPEAAMVAAPSQPAPSRQPEPEPVAVEAEPEPEPSGFELDAQAVLDQVLDDLGAAHHRPFSRG